MERTAGGGSTPEVTMWTYVWDLGNDGIEDTLKYLREEVGLTAVSVATSYHSVEHLRFHGRGPFIYRAQGSVYFRPERKRYPHTSIRPQVSPLVKQWNDPLGKIAETCRKVGLDLISWTVCCHNSWLGNANPELTMHNCFGDSHTEALCPANPDVRHYLAGLVDDLAANYGVTTAELESCHYAAERHFHRHEKVGMVFGELEHFLFSLCFCPHCSERASSAGVDPQAVKTRTAATLRHIFEAGVPAKGTVDEFVAGDAELQKFVNMRIDTVTSLLKEMKARTKARISAMSFASAAASGMDVRRAAEAIDSITVLAYSPEPEKIRSIIRTAAVPAGGAGKIRAGYHTYAPNSPDRETLLRTVGAGLDEGVRKFSFYNYGIMPRKSLAWTRDAVRLIRSG